MDNLDLSSLNSAQHEAVTAEDQNLLVLAGAGSGKTRVLVYRIAWKVINEGVRPNAILAVTFTNKAAAEMKNRLNEMLGYRLSMQWVGTFHSLAHQLLRYHWQESKLPQGFQILDSDDQFRLIKRICKSMNLPDKDPDPREIQRFINSSKDAGRRANQVAPQGDYSYKIKCAVYEAYEEACEKNGLVDFAELLLRSYELLKNNEAVRSEYHEKFSDILVDEFQDTNTIQYRWIRLMAGTKANITIVGDDDQSIYGWRGAKIENIHKFEKDFKSRIVRLEQNYRSTGTILKAANQLISKNASRMGKSLWTEANEGEKITVYESYDEYDEAHYISEKLQDYKSKGGNYQDCAILYRSNAQSRLLEDSLIRAGIPYRIYGGLRFFERAEIKDAIAYLRMITFPKDDAAFERVINVPKRGIGERTVANLRELAQKENTSLWEAALSSLDQDLITGAARRGLVQFVDFIELMLKDINNIILPDLVKAVIENTGLLDQYKYASTDKEKNKAENLEELINAATQFCNDYDSEHDTTTVLHEFLSRVALEAGEKSSGGKAKSDDDQNSVCLMTLHSAKGLEFPWVCISGVEEGLFPSAHSMYDPEKLEEERRLCYVGITRAMKKLTITYAERRNIRGYSEERLPSRFIAELPKDLLDEVRRSFSISRPNSSNGFQKRESTSKYSSGSSNYHGTKGASSQPRKRTKKAAINSPYSLGQRVCHAKFGEGTITDIEAFQDDLKIQVKFASVGTKWLISSYANLEIA